MSGLEVAGIPSSRFTRGLVVPNNHCWHLGPRSSFRGFQKRPLSSRQAPGSHLPPGSPLAPTTSWVCWPSTSSTWSTFRHLLPGALVRDHSPCPPFEWQPAPGGSARCLAPALVRAPDQVWQRAAQLLGLLLMFLGPGRWPVEVNQLDCM